MSSAQLAQSSAMRTFLDSMDDLMGKLNSEKGLDLLVEYKDNVAGLIQQYETLVTYFKRVQQNLPGLKDVTGPSHFIIRALDKIESLMEAQTRIVHALNKELATSATKGNPLSILIAVELKVVKFEVTLAKLALWIYKALCAKEEKEIQRLVSELVSLWASFNADLRQHEPDTIDLSDLLAALQTISSLDAVAVLVEQVIAQATAVLELLNTGSSV